MSLKISTGLANALLSSGSLKTALTGLHLFIYAGTEPASADAALPGDAVLLCDISGNGDGSGLAFAANAVGGTLEKDAAQVWQGTVAAAGTATFCRFAKPTDTGAASTTDVRLQGDVGVAGKFLNLNSVALAKDAIQKVEYVALTQPLQ